MINNVLQQANVFQFIDKGSLKAPLFTSPSKTPQKVFTCRKLALVSPKQKRKKENLAKTQYSHCSPYVKVIPGKFFFCMVPVLPKMLFAYDLFVFRWKSSTLWGCFFEQIFKYYQRLPPRSFGPRYFVMNFETLIWI